MAGKQTSTELSVRSSTDLAQIDELEQILLGGREPAAIEDSPEQAQQAILMELLGAESDEELERFGETVGWREIPGVPVEIRGFKWRVSEFEEGAPIYFIIQGTRRDNGENVVLTTGSVNVMAQLANMAKRGTLVGAVRSLKIADKPTQRGFKPIWLVTPPELKAAAGADRASA